MNNIYICTVAEFSKFVCPSAIYFSKSLSRRLNTASLISIGVNIKCKQSEPSCHSNIRARAKQLAPGHGFLAS